MKHTFTNLFTRLCANTPPCFGKRSSQCALRSKSAQFLFSLLVILTLGVGTAWGDDCTTLVNFATSQHQTSSPRKVYGYTSTEMTEASRVELTCDNSNTKGQNEGVEIRLDYGKYLEIPSQSSVTSVTVDYKFYNSGNTQRTCSLKVAVGSTEKQVLISGKNSDGYQPAEFTFSPAATGTIKITNMGSGSSNMNLYLDNISYCCSGGEEKDYTVTAATNNVSYGSAASSASSLDAGETTTITAMPESGYRFVSWAVSGTGASLSSTSTNPTTLTMGTADATVTATFEAIPTHDIEYTNTKSMDNSANPTSYYEGVGVASFAKLRHAVGYDFTGWSPSLISSSATTNQTIDAQWTANAVAEGTGTLTYALGYSDNTITTSSITRDNGALYDATDLAWTGVTIDESESAERSGKITTTNSYDSEKYLSLTFKIADGYTFTPTEVQLKAVAVSTDKTIRFEFTDNAETPNTKYLEQVRANGSSVGTLTYDFDASDPVTLTGTVTVKIYAYGATNSWRLGTPITITGTVAEAAAPDPSTKRVYLKCGSTWCDDVADGAPKFFVHSWGSVENDAATTLADCETDVYYADIPASNTSLIFTRQKAASTERVWSGDNFVNQSVDITIGDNDLFTCTGWSDGLATFSGSTYTAPTYTISFNNGGGTGSMSSISSLACGAEQAITANTFTKAGYAFANWTANVDVTIGDATVSAGSAIADEATIQNITSDITLTAQWTQAVPSSVNISTDSWKYFPGQTISLTANTTGGTSDFTYQWQKYVGEDTWSNLANGEDATDGGTFTGVTTNNLQISGCTKSNSGSYRCVVSKLGASVESGGYDVHVFTLEGDYSGGSDWTAYDITYTSGTAGTVAVTLNASSLFEFGIKDNFNNEWYRNTNFIIDNWTNEGFGQGSGNCRLFTGPAGSYTFTVDINHVSDDYVEVSLAYPSVSHPVAGYAYFKKWDDWNNNYYIHWWYNDGSDHPLTEWGSDVHITNETTICGTDYIYFPVLANYNQLKIKDAAGDGSHYTGDLSSVGSSGKYFDFTNDNAWNTFETYTVTFNSNGGSEVAEQNVGCGETATEPTAPTRLNYDFEGWQLAGVDYDFSTVISEDITLDAVWMRKAVPGSEEDIVIIDGTTVNTGGTLSVVHYYSTNTSNNHFKYDGGMKGSGSRVTKFTVPSGKTAVVKEITTHTSSRTYVIIGSSAVTGDYTTANTATFDTSDPYFSITGAGSLSDASKNNSMSAGDYFCGSTGSGLEVSKLTVTLTTVVPSVKLKVLGVVTQTISITVGEKLGEIFASGTLPTPVLPVGYTFKGWKNEANDAAVDNNTVTTGSMVIYADVDAPASSDATLSALTVNGDAATVDPSDATQYTFTLPFGTFAAPTVVATPTDAKAVATVTANTLSGATIEVVPETGEEDKVIYTITYSIVASKDIQLVFKTSSSVCVGSASTASQILSNNAAVSTYINQVTFTNVEGAGDNGAEGTSLNVGKKAGNMFTLAAKPGFAMKSMNFLAKIQDATCEYSLNGGEWATLTSTNTGGDECYAVFSNAEVHEFRLRSTGASGVWIRNMQLTMIQACTPQTIAWTAAPASEYEVGASVDPIAASANNGAVAYAASNGAITVNASTGALTINSLTNDIDLSASIAAGDGVIYCDEAASVVKEEIKTYYLVTFDKQNGTPAIENKYYKNGEAIALPSTPSYAGFNFLGWFDAAEGGNAVTSAVTPAASRTIYAQWEAQCEGPMITTQSGSRTYFVGREAATLVGEASAANEGELTYTWYSCDDAERTNPVELAGAPTPSTAAVGTQYYYFTVTEEGCDVVETSDVIVITVAEKDKVCLIKATLKGGTTAPDVEGYYAGSATAKTQNYNSTYDGYKLGSNGDYVGLTLASGKAFKTGDVVNIYVGGVENAKPATAVYFATAANSDNVVATIEQNLNQGNNYINLPAALNGAQSFYLYRVDSKMNPYAKYVEVLRPCPAPVLEAITFNGEAAVADELADNTFNVELTYGTNPASATVVPTVMWVGAHATTPYIILSGGEWAWGENTYRVMDKDGDYADYTINLTEALPDAEVPVIATDLTDQAYCAGEIPELDATANAVSDGGTLSYQWYDADGLIEGAISATYTPAGEGSYYCKVTNTLADHRPMTTTSATAVLTQKAATSISGDAEFEIEQGATVKFQPTVTGANATYAWYACDAEGNHEGDQLGNKASYTTPVLNDVGTFYYVLEVIADCGNASQIFTVNVADLGGSLIAHTPGHYYGQELKEYDGKYYEIYGMSRISSKNYLWAGTPISASTDENCVMSIDVNPRGEWLINGMAGQQSQYSSISDRGPFNATSLSSTYQMKFNKKTNRLVLKVKGYDQFLMLSKDQDTDTEYLEVTIDGVAQPRTKSSNSSGAVNSFDLDGEEHIIIVRPTTDHENLIFQFALRLPYVAQVEGDEDSKNVSLQALIDATGATPASFELLANCTEEVSVADGQDITLNGGGHRLQGMSIEQGGKVTLSSTLNADQFVLASTAGKSGQLMGATNLHADAVYMDVRFYNTAETLDETSANQWYMISAPFDVNLNGGFFLTNGTPMTFGQTDGDNIFDLFEYDGAKRANTGVTGWERARGKMHGGRACLIGFNPGQATTIRLKAANNALAEPSSIALQAFAGDADNQNWNGVANPTLHYTNISCDVQTYNNEEGENGRKYIAYSYGSYSFVVGTPFFVQATGSIDLSAATHDQFRAPKRESDRYEACVRIFRSEATDFADQMYVRASETASSDYEPGHDMITWNGTSAKTALIWANNYGKRLAIEEAPLVADEATYALGLYAPKTGMYRIEVVPQDDVELYLTKDGRSIWNLTMGAYEVELAQGTNNGYGLVLRAKAPAVATGIEEAKSKVESVQKVVINEHVFILRNGQMFDVTGKAVK